jgi:hypothetical protein
MECVSNGVAHALARLGKKGSSGVLCGTTLHCLLVVTAMIVKILLANE